jgi:multidrug resistance efflux pump
MCRAVEVTEAELRVSQKAVEDTVLRAPFDGVMARKLVEDFANVNAKEPVLVFQDTSHLEIQINIPERDRPPRRTTGASIR